MTQVKITLRDRFPKKLPEGFSLSKDGKVARVDVECLVVTQRHLLPVAESVMLLRFRSSWSIKEGYYMWGRIRISVNHRREITVQGWSLPNFAKAITKIKNDEIGDWHRVPYFI